ncbi:MAG TPA: DUF2235 domain-containing protein [Lysobacter sp.]
MHDLESYEQASRELAQLRAPVLVRSSNPHERLFLAAFDGTGNSKFKDPDRVSNVGQIFDQVQTAIAGGHKGVRAEYLEGPGTQDNPITRVIDQATGFTYDARIEEMYDKFTKQAKEWLRKDPQAQIRVVEIGFSRGAEQAAGFARLVHERGIQDPKGKREHFDENGVRHIEYTRPPLVPPGRIAQTVGLFDPVGTGEPRDHDRRLPPSVVSGFQITAEDERRNLFKSTNIIDPGMTEGGRFLNVTVGGAHSNIGGSYALNGLSVRSFNLMTDYLNALSDPPYLRKQALPATPGVNVVHRSEEHQFFYRTSDFDKDGLRDRMEQLTSAQGCRAVADCRNKEPHDESIAAPFAMRLVPIAPTPAPPSSAVSVQLRFDPRDPGHPDHALFRQGLDKMRAANALSPERWDDTTVERVAAGLVLHVKQDPAVKRIDEVVLSHATPYSPAGERVFAVYRPFGDKAPYFRTDMDTRVAANTPVEQTFQQLDAHKREQQQATTPLPAQQDQQDQQQSQQRGGLSR